MIKNTTQSRRSPNLNTPAFTKVRQAPTLCSKGNIEFTSSPRYNLTGKVPVKSRCFSIRTSTGMLKNGFFISIRYVVWFPLTDEYRLSIIDKAFYCQNFPGPRDLMRTFAHSCFYRVDTPAWAWHTLGPKKQGLLFYRTGGGRPSDAGPSFRRHPAPVHTHRLNLI